MYDDLMFGALADLLDSLVVPAQSDALTQIAQQHARLEARLSDALGAYDHSGHWELDGSASMTAWTRVHLGWTNQTANRWLRRARRLRDLPVTRQAWLDGTLTDGQIDIIIANLTDRRAGLFAQHEADVIATFEPLDIHDTTTAMRRWAAMADAVLDEPEAPEEPAASASLVQTLDGRGYLKGTFDAEHSDLITTGLRMADCGDRELSNAERQGQAMVDVFRFYLDHQGDKLAKRHRPHLNVVVTHEHLHDEGPGRALDGNPLPGLVIRKIACDANIHRVITDGRSSILDYGRSTRTIPPAVYTSLVLRDLGCRFPGCDRRAEWCEGHHIWHWEDGGPTDLTNLVLLCSRHHHRIHMAGWHIKLRPDGAVEVTQPDGTVRTSDPPLLC